jgi:putative phosphoesterase
MSTNARVTKTEVLLMKCLIFSDSHGYSDAMKRIISYHKDAEAIFFLGDGLDDIFSCKQYDNIIVHAVRGNCDGYTRFSPYGEEIPTHRVITIGSYKIFMAHGHTLSVKSGYDELCREATRNGADIALFGHTHLPTLEYIEKGSIRGVDRDLVLFNPGSLSGVLDGSFGNLSISDDGFLFSHGKYHNIIKNK